MSDVRSDTAPATDTSARSDPHGNFIWYELMTPDPDGAKAFYDAVVGWDIEPEPTGEAVMDYRMIRRSDGGNAGGVLRITEEMASHGARPGWRRDRLCRKRGPANGDGIRHLEWLRLRRSQRQRAVPTLEG